MLKLPSKPAATTSERRFGRLADCVVGSPKMLAGAASQRRCWVSPVPFAPAPVAIVHTEPAPTAPVARAISDETVPAELPLSELARLAGAVLIVCERLIGLPLERLGWVRFDSNSRAANDVGIGLAPFLVTPKLGVQAWLAAIEQGLRQAAAGTNVDSAAPGGAATEVAIAELSRRAATPSVESPENAEAPHSLESPFYAASQPGSPLPPIVFLPIRLVSSNVAGESSFEPEQIVLCVDFDPHFVEPALAEQLLERVVQTAQALAVCAQATVESLLQWPDAEVVISALNESPAGADQTVVQVFDTQTAINGQAQALCWPQGELSYEQLQTYSVQLAERFKRQGLAAGDVVALKLERSPEVYVCLLAILRIGACYLPIEASFPAARVQLMLEQAGARFVLSSRPVNPKGAAAEGNGKLDLEVLELAALVGVNSADSLPPMTAYIMYTSGSTGVPKGVVIGQRSILRLVKQAKYLRLDASLRMLQAAPLGFDAATLEIWGPLLNGGCCVLHDERVPTARGLARTIRAHQVNTAWLTASLFNHVVEQGSQHLHGLEQLAIGGEALSVTHVRRVLEAMPDLRLVNGYGPTECTTFALTFDIARPLPAQISNIPIGYPITDTLIRILNARGEQLPAGFVGELYLGGSGLAHGYVADAALTAERFVPDPYLPAQRLYRTGDRVRSLANGAVEFLGRADQQIKLRGHRIEIAEIETLLGQLPGVGSCAVAVRREIDPDGQLVAYVSGAASEFAPKVWKQALALHLPEAMLPAAWVHLSAMPVTLNGKLDRNALPVPSKQRPDTAGSFEVPAGDLEIQLAASFASILGIEPIGALDNFFELGGSSLAAVRLSNAVSQASARDLPVAWIYNAPTVRALAQKLGEQASIDVVAGGVGIGGVHEPIAIIGMALRLPGANSLTEFWRNLQDGRDSITRFELDALDASIAPDLRNDRDYVAARGVIANPAEFDAEFFGISPAEAELMDPQQRVFLELCWECMEHAGHAPGSSASDGASGNTNVGVFAGVYNASYLQHHVRAHPEKLERFGAFQVMLANEKDYVATRVAHRLNLTGPAVNVFTACSTSLVAMAQAVDQLRLGRCDAALAGGAAITCPPNSGYLYQEGSMLSPDACTRSFDVSAAGTVFSDGAAVVMLKRLSDAIADRDTVYALIRGVATNNDGADKSSFTAPSVQGQRAVVVAALNDAQLTPDAIDYVEAHGTATPIGDPIELEALSQAYRSFKPAPVSLPNTAPSWQIGSVKSNIGHTVMAAGAAGVIKTVLAMQHELLPKSLHYKQPNPQLRLEQSGFKVVAENQLWPRGTRVRRAAVSSFGVGGTNAHLVLQEAPLQAASDSLATAGQGEHAEIHTLRLSARSAPALLTAAANLAVHLKANPEVRLSDVAYTLDHGRKMFAHRLAVVAERSADAIAALEQTDSAMRVAGKLPVARASVVFMFPGQGAQYAAMGRTLYQRDTAFAAALDHCFATLIARLQFDLKTPLFSGDPSALAPTAMTQPALFAIEYALAQSLLARGLRPAALVGHSVGEFVAAALAGVMSVEDAIVLVAQRGALMQAQPAGQMLAVRTSVATLEPLLPESLSIAAENAANAIVVAGPQTEIDAFRQLLEHRGILARVLQTSHAFHSAMMTPAVAPFEQLIRNVRLRPPELPIMSTVTGQWLTAEQACDPQYWAQHLRLPVRFFAASSALLAEADRVFVEVGPRTSLATLVRAQLKPAGGSNTISVLTDTVQGEAVALNLAQAKLWTSGVSLTPLKLPAGQRIALPTYPFERKRYWLDALPASIAAPLTAPLIAPLKAALTSPLPVPFPASLPALMSNAPVNPMSTSAVQRGDDLRAKIIQDVSRLFESISGIELTNADPDARFAELGFDSLTLTQVALQIKRTFGVKVSFRELMTSFRSLNGLVDHLCAQMPVPAAQTTAAISASTALATTQQSAPNSTALVAPMDPNAAGIPANLASVLQQQLLLMQQQLEILRLGAQALPATTNVVLTPANNGVAVSPAARSEQSAESVQKYDVKKAFGAIARIHTQSSDELSARQRSRLDALITRYQARTKASKAYTAAHREHLSDPRVVNGFRPALKEIVYQIVIERSQGAYIWDVDGNRYVDALNGFGMSLFGWQPPFVAQALKTQIDLGYEIGPQHPLAGIVAQQICEMTGFDRAAFCNTGSEAVMGAIRIARTVTGRPLIVSFTGAYHGIFDEVVVRGTKSLKTVPAAPGIMANAGENVLVLEYGSDESLQIIRERADDIAAVLVEPVQSRRPDFQPKAFLQALRALTADHEIALVFDEVVTGFRAHPGGVQALFGIRADIATYGKVIGGGLSIGVVAGKREYMDALDGGAWKFGDDSIPTVGVTYFAGTFVRHPLALAAAHSVLNHLKEQGPALQEGLNRRTDQLVNAMNEFCRSRSAPIEIRHFSSVWRVVFTQEHAYQDLLFAMMRSRGVHVLDNFPCFMTTAHSPEDFTLILEAFKDSVVELQEANFIPGRRVEPVGALDANKPPVPGARLGRNRDGQIAWFVESPEQAGKFVEMKTS